MSDQTTSVFRAVFDQQEALKARFRSESALQNGLMSPWHVRLDAMRALAFQGRDQEIVEAALTEQDAPAIMDFALAVALPASPDLIEHKNRGRSRLFQIPPGLSSKGALRKKGVRLG